MRKHITALAILLAAPTMAALLAFARQHDTSAATGPLAAISADAFAGNPYERPAPRVSEKYAEIKFDTLTISLGTFSEKDGDQHCTFRFRNTGTAPLIINQAHASCGCTVPSYSKDPVKPGKEGVIEVTYNGSGKHPGKFKKTITVRTNTRSEITRLTIVGMMTE